MKYYSNAIHHFKEFKVFSWNIRTNIGTSWYETSKFTIIATNECYTNMQCIYINLVPLHLKNGPMSTWFTIDHSNVLIYKLDWSFNLIWYMPNTSKNPPLFMPHDLQMRRFMITFPSCSTIGKALACERNSKNVKSNLATTLS
jgi:hypothetical protein